jgi:hypothetical protein
VLAAARAACSLAIKRGPRSGQSRERSKGIQLKKTDINRYYCSQKKTLYRLGIVPMIAVCSLEEAIETQRLRRPTVFHRSRKELFETCIKCQKRKPQKKSVVATY